MKSIVGLVALLVCGCAGTLRNGADGQAGAAEPRTTVSVRSYHGEAMDVYAICGEHDGVRLGSVEAEGEAEFTPARSDMVCATGLRFAMVPAGRKTGGFLTEPMAIMPRHIDLLIEKYPALSYWRAR
ncbi:MAG TPA: hypothetical protein VF832_16100 [Longimicrobiales bacterium]